MDIRPLTPLFAVSPQITPEDIPAIKAAGFTTILDNRPDAEVPPELQGDAVEAAAREGGLSFRRNPIVPGQVTPDVIATQGNTLAEADGGVLAYCASGTRSTTVWALSQAGKVPAGELIEAAAKAGYNLEPMRAQLGG
ncbi:MAG: TIGR01244 family sulfur transferase [Shimia sp.]